MTKSREDKITHELAALRSTLQAILHRSGDCYIDGNRSPCIARMALARFDDGMWRFKGAAHYRAVNGHNPRETVAAWASVASDQVLGWILYPKRDGTVEPVSVRDWFVATSVVQWLATNVGMEVLRRAGFEFTQWNDDRSRRDNDESEDGDADHQ